MRSLFLTLILPMAASAAPLEIAHQGRLLDSSGTPVDGAHDVTVRIYDETGATTALWEDTFSVTLDNGFYGLVLGSGKALDATAFADDSLWVGIELDTDGELADRIGLSSVPYALNATSVSGGVVNASDLQVNGSTLLDSSGNIDFAKIGGLPSGLSDGDSDTLADLTCSSGQLVSFNGSAWTCTNGASGDISADAITSGQLDIERIPVGTGSGTVAAGDHTHDFSHTHSYDEITGTPSNASPGSSEDAPAYSCEAIRYLTPGAESGAFYIDPAGTGTPIRVWCEMQWAGGGWIDLVKSVHINGNDAKALGETFFGAEDDPQLALTFSAGTSDNGTAGLLIEYVDNDHEAGIFLDPIGQSGLRYTEVDLSYQLQGSDDDYRCGSGNWIPLSGPNYNGGYGGYLVSCPDGYSCTQGTPTGSRDEPIAASYSTRALGWTELLTWSGSATGTNSRNCARDAQIPSDKPALYFSKLMIR